MSSVKCALLTNAFTCKWTLLGECAGAAVSCVWVDARWEAGVGNRGNPANGNGKLWELAKIPGRTSF